ncbi:MAG: hypothetical protein AB2A00_09945 [Myxococcota bacterium]
MRTRAYVGALLLLLGCSEWRGVVSDTEATLLGMWGPTPDDVWAVGQELGPLAIGQVGRFVHWDGRSWTQMDQVDRPLNTIHGTAHDDIWAGGAGKLLLHFDGSTWQPVSLPDELPPLDIKAIRALARDNVWIGVEQPQVSTEGRENFRGPSLLHWDGASWTSTTLRDEEDDVTGASSLAFVSPSDGWAGGVGALFRWDGTTWNRLEPVAYWVALWAVSSTDVWAASFSGELAHFDGSGWSSTLAPTSRELKALWGASSDEIWAVGDTGTLLRWDGSSWERTPSGTNANLGAIHGFSADDVWIGGQYGVIRHHP